MINLYKAEILKIFTVRSTYILIGLAILLEIFVGFLIGYHATGADLHNTQYLSTQISDAIAVVTIFSTIIAILLMSNEYRYNTIMYTLTYSNSRSKILIAKIGAIASFAVIYSIVTAILAVLLIYLGINVHHLTLVHQTFYYWDIIWRVVFYCCASMLFGLLWVLYFRSIVAAIVIMFLIPSTVEPLIGLLIKDNKIYLPYTALGQVLTKAPNGVKQLSFENAAIVSLIYICTGFAIGWTLFLRRDATN